MSTSNGAREIYGKAIGIGLVGLAALAADGLLTPTPTMAAPGVGGWDLATNKKAFAADDVFPVTAGGVSIAAGDVDGDGFADIFTGTGPGGDGYISHWKWKISDNSFVVADKHQDNNGAGATVAVGDVNRDGIPDVVTTNASGATASLSLNFTKITYNYKTPNDDGRYIAVGDVDGDGRADVVTGSKAGGGSPGLYETFSYKLNSSNSPELDSTGSQNPYGQGYTGGVRVAVGSRIGPNDNGALQKFSEIITSPDQGASPEIDVFNGLDAGSKDAAKFSSFTADSSGSNQGVFIAAGDFDGDGNSEIVTGAGPGGLPYVSVYKFDGSSWVQTQHALVYDSSYLGGVTVAVGDFDNNGSPDILFAPATAVPEPSSIAMIVTGAGALLTRRRRLGRGEPGR